MKPTWRQDEGFIHDVLGSTILESAISWIINSFEPADIYPKDELAAWAEANGYVKEDV